MVKTEPLVCRISEGGEGGRGGSKNVEERLPHSLRVYSYAVVLYALDRSRFKWKTLHNMPLRSRVCQKRKQNAVNNKKPIYDQMIYFLFIFYRKHASGYTER